jgi:hypothetical protein
MPMVPLSVVLLVLVAVLVTVLRGAASRSKGQRFVYGALVLYGLVALPLVLLIMR